MYLHERIVKIKDESQFAIPQKIRLDMNSFVLFP